MRSVSHVRHCVEGLECRRLLAGVNLDLGSLQGRSFQQGSVDGPTQDVYHVTLTQQATIDVQLSRLLFGEARVLLFNDGSSSTAITASSFSTSDRRLTFQALSAGTFSIKVDAPAGTIRTFYTLEVTTDYAPGEFAASSGTNVRADLGRNLGQLHEGSISVRDFTGFFDTSDHAAKDALDVYFFDLPATGLIDLTLDSIATDTANNFAQVKMDAAIYKDSNNNGKLEASEQIVGVTADVNSAGSINPKSLDAGHYAVVISRLQPTNVTIGGSNYRLTLNYNVFDGARNTLALAKDVGTLGSATKAFNDFISDDDTVDIYKFATGEGGPFLFDAKLNGLSGANFDIDLIRDGNNNGQIDILAGEILANSINPGTFNEHIAKLLVTPGTYFMRVRQVIGQSTYTLAMSSSNQDRAGNSLATATNIGQLQGQQAFSDAVSATDTDDIYRFNTTAAETIAASFPATASGTNADLQLVQDLNNDHAIQANEVLAASGNAGAAGESISRVSNPGTYFLIVHRVAGTPVYDLTLSLDTAGSTAAAARLLGTNQTTTEFVGAADMKDIFRVDLPGSLQFNVFFLDLGSPILMSVAVDSNHNGTIDGLETGLTRTISDPAARFVFNFKGPVSVFVTVQPGATDTNYTIRIANAPTDAGGDAPSVATDALTANADGPILSATIHDFVGDGSIDAVDDVVDFYRVRLTDGGPFLLSATLSQLTGDAALQLIFDANGNGNVDAGEVLVTQNHTGTTPEQISLPVTAPGDYYLKVFRVSGEANYALTVNANRLDGAGNSLGTAKNLGNLTGTLTAADALSAIDSKDVFKFSVASASELAASLSGSPGAPPLMSIIRDVNGNGQVDGGDVIADSSVTGTSLNGVFLPVIGTYFVEVDRPGVDASYSVALTFSSQTPFHNAPFIISNTGGGTKIEAEDFDNGGPGVAYADATASNNDGSARNTDQVDVKAANEGGFRVTDTAVGEFLEYTIFVQQSANYDFDFRVASPDPGGSFHAEVDGANVTGVLNVPVTGNVQSFTTVTKTAVPLTAGPHILRLAFDSITGGGSHFAGTYNFIKIRPSTASTGTFALLPKTASIVKVGQAVTGTLLWTVPSGSWHVLKDVQLRLVDELGNVVARFKFDEASGTFSLFNAATGAFGPAKKPGTTGSLDNAFVKIDLAGSKIQGAGPTATSVALTIRVTFKSPAGGHTFRVEAAASDDLGHSQAFALAGSVKVIG